MSNDTKQTEILDRLVSAQEATNALLARVLAGPKPYEAGDELTHLQEVRRAGKPVDTRSRTCTLTLLDNGVSRLFGSGSGDVVAEVPAVIRVVVDAKDPGGRTVEIVYDMAGAPTKWLSDLYDAEHQQELAECSRDTGMTLGADAAAHYRAKRGRWIAQAGWWRVRAPIARFVGKPVTALRNLAAWTSEWAPEPGSSGAIEAKAETAPTT